MIIRTLMVAIAALGLATAALPEDATTATTATTTTTTTTQTATTTQEKVNVNKATAKELEKVTGLNSSKAKAIVSYRKKHGDFKSLDELKSVKGFKRLDKKTMQEIQDQLTVG